MDAHLAGIAAGLEIVCARRLGNRDDALDATQETLTRLLTCAREGGIASLAELAPIAYGIARHVIADLRRARWRASEDVPDPPAAPPNALDVLVREEQRNAVATALERLSAADRDLLRRCFMEGEPIGLIAKALGEPAERLRKRKSRALQRLAAVLGCTTDASVTLSGLTR